MSIINQCVGDDATAEMLSRHLLSTDLVSHSQVRRIFAPLSSKTLGYFSSLIYIIYLFIRIVDFILFYFFGFGFFFFCNNPLTFHFMDYKHVFFFFKLKYVEMHS
jgi:hypothetical protein